MLTPARRTAASAPAAAQPDAPDILRLAALLAEREGHDADAAQLAEEAEPLYRAIASRFPVAHAAVLADLARMQFHADPNNVARAIASARSAIATIKPLDLGDAAEATNRRDLVLYLLAAGDEPTARSEVVPLTARDNPVMIDMAIGELYAALAARFLDTRTERRPASFEGWVERALTLNHG